MKQFFKSNFIKSIGLFILFSLINILLAIGIIYIFSVSNNDISSENDIKFKEIEESLDGSVKQKNLVTDKLKEQDSFYLLINPDGNVVSEEFLPEELNHNYSRAEIASFSRWYLGDYPVNTKILDNGNILVIGYPKDSMVKYSFTYKLRVFLQTLIFFPLLLVLNFVIFIILFWIQQNKVRKEIEPVINGINELASGKKLSLSTEGQLGKIKEELNLTSKQLLKQEKERKEWISGVTHDIRTPLASILASSELIEVNEQNKEHLNLIQDNVVRLSELVESLNLINKLNHDYSITLTKYQNVAGILRSSIVEFINSNNIDPDLIRLNVTSEFEELFTDLDPFLFERLIFNLLNNWLSHNKSGTLLQVEAFKSVNDYILEGQNMINPVGEEDSDVHYGLGLEIVEQICKLHGWKFSTETGSDFKFVIRIVTSENY